MTSYLMQCFGLSKKYALCHGQYGPRGHGATPASNALRWDDCLVSLVGFVHVASDGE